MKLAAEAAFAPEGEPDAEAEAVIAHFRERPTITAEDCTEEDARWIMRYDAVRAKYARLGMAVPSVPAGGET